MASFLESLNVPPSEKTLIPKEGNTSVKNILDARSI